MNVARRAVESGGWSLAANIGQQAVNFCFFVYMARILDPSAFGLIALALVVTDLLGLIGRLGTVEAIIQRKHVDDSVQNELFWLLQYIGIGCSVLVFLLSGSFGAAFKHEDLVPVLASLSFVCWLQNSSVIPEARLQTVFGYKTLAKRTLWSSTLGGLIGCITVWIGCGVYGLVAQKITTVLIQNTILWRAEKWRPSRPVLCLGQEAKELLGVGAHVLTSGVMLTLNTKLMDLLIGAFMGPATLGYVRTAWKCFEVVLYCTVQPLSSVALVTFTNVRDSDARLFAAYERLTQTSSLALFPILLGLSAVAPLIVPLAFGPQWEPSAPLLRLLGFMAAAGVVGPFFGPFMTATGNAKLLVKQSLVQTALSCVFTGLSAPFGAPTVIIGQVLRSVAMSCYNLILMRRVTGIPLKATVLSMEPALVSATFMWLVLIFLLPSVATMFASKLVSLSSLIAIGATVYFLSLVLIYKRTTAQLKREIVLLRKGSA